MKTFVLNVVSTFSYRIIFITISTIKIVRFLASSIFLKFIWIHLMIVINFLFCPTVTVKDHVIDKNNFISLRIDLFFFLFDDVYSLSLIWFYYIDYFLWIFSYGALREPISSYTFPFYHLSSYFLRFPFHLLHSFTLFSLIFYECFYYLPF